MNKKEVVENMKMTDNSKLKWKGTWKSFIPTIIIILLILFFFHSQIFNFFKPIDTSPTNFEKTAVYTFPDKAVIGTPWKYNFSKELIPLLESTKTTDSTSELKNDTAKNNTNFSSGSISSTSYVSYIVYLGSGAGSLPTGLTLSTNGVLEGTLTGDGGKFEICIKDNNEIYICRIYQLNVGSIIDNNPPDNNVNPENNNPPNIINSFAGNWKTLGPVKFYEVELGYAGENNQRMSEINARSLSLWIKINGGFISGDCSMDFISCNQLSTYDGAWTACIPQVPYPGGGEKYAGPLSFGSSFDSPKIVGNKLTTSRGGSSQNQDRIFTLVEKDSKYGGKDVLYVELTSVGGGYDSDPGTIVLVRENK